MYIDADNNVVFLIISELPICRSYFDQNWPLLGENSGFFTLAAAMFMLGSGVLSNLNHKEMAQYWLGMTFWRIVLSAGILALVMSAINAVAVSYLSPQALSFDVI